MGAPMPFDVQEMLAIARGEISPQCGVTGVAGVTIMPRYASKSPELRQLRPLRIESEESGKDAYRGVIEGVARWPTSPSVGIEEPSALGAVDRCICGQRAVLTVYNSANPSEPTRMCRACCDALHQQILRERARQAP